MSLRICRLCEKEIDDADCEILIHNIVATVRDSDGLIHVLKSKSASKRWKEKRKKAETAEETKCSTK